MEMQDVVQQEVEEAVQQQCNTTARNTAGLHYVDFKEPRTELITFKVTVSKHARQQLHILCRDQHMSLDEAVEACIQDGIHAHAQTCALAQTHAHAHAHF